MPHRPAHSPRPAAGRALTLLAGIEVSKTLQHVHLRALHHVQRSPAPPAASAAATRRGSSSELCLSFLSPVCKSCLISAATIGSQTAVMLSSTLCKPRCSRQAAALRTAALTAYTTAAIMAAEATRNDCKLHRLLELQKNCRKKQSCANALQKHLCKLHCCLQATLEHPATWHLCNSFFCISRWIFSMGFNLRGFLLLLLSSTLCNCFCLQSYTTAQNAVSCLPTQSLQPDLLDYCCCLQNYTTA